MTDTDYPRRQSFALVFLAVVVGLGLLYITKSFMVPFAIALFLSFLIVPVANFLERRRVPSVISNLIIFVGVAVVIFLIGLLMYASFVSIRSGLPEYMSRARTYTAGLIQAGERLFAVELTDDMEKFSFRDVFHFLSPSSFVKLLNQSIGSFVVFLSKMLLTMLFLLFIFATRKTLMYKAGDFLGTRREANQRQKIIMSIVSDIQSYLWLKTLISLGTGFVFGLAAFLMGLDFYLVWGFLGFLLNYIPSIGPIMASIPPILLAFLQFDSMAWALTTSILMAAVQFTSGMIVEPKLMGDRLNLNIVVILLSLFLWGLLWGGPGMILAIPITAAINIVLNNIPRYQRVSALLSK